MNLMGAAMQSSSSSPFTNCFGCSWREGRAPGVNTMFRMPRVPQQRTLPQQPGCMLNMVSADAKGTATWERNCGLQNNGGTQYKEMVRKKKT